MSHILVTFHQPSGRFHIECPIYANDRVRGLPNKRWNPKIRKWTVPAIRVNNDILRQWLQDGVALFDAESREALSKAKDDARKHNTPFPSWYKFKRPPRLAQQRAFERMYGMTNLALFMDMRTGKTKVLIDMMCALRMEGKIDHMLLVCPINIRRNWIKEIGIDATIPIDYHLLTTKDKGKSFTKWLTTPSDFKVLMVGVESLKAGSAKSYCERFLRTCSKPMIALDESQSIKTHDSNTSEVMHGFRDYAKYRVIMTGTSMSRSSVDLYSQFEFLNPDIIGCGDFYTFRNRYVIMGGFENKQVIGFTNQEELMDLIAPYVYQVAQADAIDVPEKTYEIISVPMTDEQKHLYTTFRRTKQLHTADGSLEVEMAMQMIQRSHEISGGSYTTEIAKEDLEFMREKGLKVPRFTHHRIDGRNPKVEESLRIAKEIEGSIIFWCAYKMEVAMLVEALASQYGRDSVVEIHGSVAEADRFDNVQKFQAGTARFLVGNAATGGVGLTLSRAETIVYYSSNFALLDRQQSEERATGGTPVLIIDLLTEGSVDWMIYKALKEKKDVTAYVREQINKRVPFERIMDDNT